MVDFVAPIHQSHKIVHLTEAARTFVCGDLHGAYDELTMALELAEFDEAKDLLIILGDITDRGPQCYECLKLLDQPWCTSILGNHDEMMRDGVNPRSDRAFWRANGGGWFDQLDEEQREHVRYLCERRIESLPISMTLVLPDASTVGLIHADAPKDWRHAMDGTQQRMEALWGRTRIRKQDRSIVANIDMVLSGHTSNNNIIKLGNVAFIDTGAGFRNGFLTVIEVGNSLTELTQNIERSISDNTAIKRPDIVFEQVGNYASEGF